MVRPEHWTSLTLNEAARILAASGDRYNPLAQDSTERMVTDGLTS